jgi:tricarballylate dehydrogenase
MKTVVVVGAGNAALTAAIAARHAGARVIVLEKAPYEERGGNSRFSGGLFRFAYNGIDDIQQVHPTIDPGQVDVGTYPNDAYYADIMRVTDGLADPKLTEILVGNSHETVRWMASVGVRWDITHLFRVNEGPRIRFAPGAVLMAKGEGVGLVADLFSSAERHGAEIRYDSKCVGLNVNDAGRIIGVQMRGPNGLESMSCDAVILAPGGFEANVEMRVKYLGALWDRARVRGTRFNTGEMIEIALGIGAKPYGNWSGCHATPIDADAPWVGELALTDKTNRLSYIYGIMVNRTGSRFVDEGEDFASHTYARTGAAILAQPGAVAYQIFDQKALDLLEERYETGRPTIADSLPELGERLGLPTAAFKETVDAYNASTHDGTGFDPTTRDGKSTRGLALPKSNWATPLDSPPFVAYPITCGITFTYGGLAINESAQVLDREDRPIPGLYATGEITGGFFYGNYPGGAGLTRGAVFGRIAGCHAAVHA